MDPVEGIREARLFLDVQGGEHLEVPLLKLIDPVRELRRVIGRFDDRGKLFLRQEIRNTLEIKKEQKDKQVRNHVP